MEKLITAHQENPSAKTIAKLLSYISKHPMAMCFATPEQQIVINKILAGEST